MRVSILPCTRRLKFPDLRTISESLDTRSSDTIVGVDTPVDNEEDVGQKGDTNCDGQQLDDGVVALHLAQHEDGKSVKTNEDQIEEEISEVKLRDTYRGCKKLL
jgi:hypothetical protein